jgi:hypothetical protein
LRAYCLIREYPHYRREAFVAGLARAGYQVSVGHPGRSRPGDLLVIWNRYGHYDQVASAHERAGGIVLVAENGYIGQDKDGVQLYALAVHGHNGSGWWPEGDGARWEELGVEIKPWRAEGEHLYVRGQRGIGTSLMASPPQWHHALGKVLRRTSKRKVVVVDHPGKPACQPGQVAVLQRDMDGAHACLIWSSAVGVRALVEGVPAFYSAPHWVCAGAALRGLERLEDPLMDDEVRLRALERMAWAQWTVAELASGEPFKRLVECDFRQRGSEEAVAA